MGLVRALLLVIAMLATPVLHAADATFAPVDPKERMQFPRDHGAHPDQRTEWWYVTGWLKTADGEEIGYQVTFFRAKAPTRDENPSKFAPHQLILAHAAIADRKIGRLVSDQRIAREGFDIAGASTEDARVKLDQWSFTRIDEPVPADGNTAPLHFRTRVVSSRFVLDLDLRGDGPPLEQGSDAARPGFSQKGPSPAEASRYYSVPRLTATGTVSRPASRAEGAPLQKTSVNGTGWLDREWSSAYMNPQAVGWDWIGINLDDGGALMAFQMRDHRGQELWAGGARRFADGRVERYGPDDIEFKSLRIWTSPVSGAMWPISQTITIARKGVVGEEAGIAAGVTPLVVTLDPLMENQELDSRDTTGTFYWEGAVRARKNDARRTPLGKGYLEMTGYWRPMKF